MPSAVLTERRPAVADRAFRLLTLACGLMVLAVLVLITISTTQQAWPAFRHEGIGFVTGTRWAPNNDVFGALPFIYGTLVTSIVAIVMAVPISVGIALFLNEAAPRPLRRPVIYLVDLLAAIPSV